jgi:hypothetical protein
MMELPQNVIGVAKRIRGSGHAPNSFVTGLIDDIRLCNRAVRP